MLSSCIVSGALPIREFWHPHQFLSMLWKWNELRCLFRLLISDQKNPVTFWYCVVMRYVGYLHFSSGYFLSQHCPELPAMVEMFFVCAFQSSSCKLYVNTYWTPEMRLVWLRNLILIYFNFILNSHMWLEVTISDSTAIDVQCSV